MAEIEIPPYFLCPITLDLMQDPVTVSTGITYDRHSIEKWIFTQNRTTCPSTNQPLHSLDLTPNVTLRRLIQSWCTLNASAHGVRRLPTPKPPATRPQLINILRRGATHPSHCLQTLKSIAAENQTNKRCMESAGVAEFLAALITGKAAEASDSDDKLSDFRQICDDALGIIYTLKLSESGLKPLITVEFFGTLTLIMQRGNDESRSYAVMLLKSMLEIADPSLLIALKPNFFSEITQLLNDDISKKSSKAALKLLITACPWGRNRMKAVEAGAVATLINILLDSTDKRVCEMIMTALDILCRCADGRAALVKHGGGLAAVSKKILRVSRAASEKAVRILHSVSKYSATAAVLAEMLEVGVVAKLWLVVEVDCGGKTKERAMEILKSHAKAWRNSTCMPNNFISSSPS